MSVRRLLLVLLALTAALDLVVAGIRAGDVLSFGRVVIFPAEGPVLYAIWKLRRAHPLYEWPMAPVFTLTLYNFLFYETYAWAMRLLRVADAAMPVAARFVTLVLAAAGALVQYVASRRVFAAVAPPRLLLALLAIVSWLGAVLPGWWALSIRPDVPAALCALVGVWAALEGFAGRPSRLAIASLSFLAAWCFKQSDVAVFAATCVYAAVRGGARRDLPLLAGPFAAGAAFAIVTGGATYRANIITAPSLNPWLPHLPLHWLRMVALTDVLPWLGAGLAIVTLARAALRVSPPTACAAAAARSRECFGLDLTCLSLVTLTTLVVTAVLLSKVGSALNHALDLQATASLLCAGVLAGAWRQRRASTLLAASAALAPMLAFTLLLLAGRDRATAGTLLQLKAWGDELHLISPERAADRQGAAAPALIDALPAPVYTEDETLPPPWRALDAHFPGVIVDHVFYDEARRRGRIDIGVDGLFRQRYIGSLAVLTDESPFVPIAIRSGYRLRRTFVYSSGQGEPLRILVRDR